MKSLIDSAKEWLAAIVLLVLIVVLWAWFTLAKSLILIPVYIVSKFKDESVILGKRVNWAMWARNMFLSDDQSVNAVLGGDRDITISSRVGYNAIFGNGIALKMELVIDWLFYITTGQKQHCRASVERDEKHNKKWGG